MRKIYEKAVENQILNMLHKMGVYCWKIQKTGIYDKTNGIFRRSFNAFHINGVSDICGVLPGGRALFIEVKRPNLKDGRIVYRTQEQISKMASDDQKEFINKARAFGAVAFYCDSPDVLIEQLTLYGIPYKSRNESLH